MESFHDPTPSVLHRSPDLKLKTKIGLNHHHHHPRHHSPQTTFFLTSWEHTEGSHQNKKISKQLEKVHDIPWSQRSDQNSTAHYWDTTTHTRRRGRVLLDRLVFCHPQCFTTELHFMFFTKQSICLMKFLSDVRCTSPPVL